MSVLDRFAGWLGIARPQQRVAPIKTIGVGGTAVLGGYPTPAEKNSALVSPQRAVTYREMIYNDDTIGGCVRLFLTLLALAKWRCDPPEGDDSAEAREVADFVRYAVVEDGSLSTPWSEVVQKTAMYLFEGHAILEWTARRVDEHARWAGAIALRDVEERAQHTIAQWDCDITGTVQGVVQHSPWTGEHLYIPRRKVIYAVDSVLAKGDPTGVGLLRHCVRLARRIEREELLEMFGYETDQRGIPKGYAPLAELQEQKRQELITTAEYDAALKGIRSYLDGHVLHPGLAILLDSSVIEDVEGKPSGTRKWDVDLLKGGGTGHEAIGRAIERDRKSLARVLGMEGLFLGDQGGSRALGSSKNKVITARVNQALGYLAAVYNADLVGPLMRLNGHDMRLRPRLAAEDVTLEEVAEITAAFADMASAGAMLMPDDPAINVIRDKLGVPPQPERSVREMAELRAAVSGGLVEDPNAQDPNAQPPSGPGQRPAPGQKRPNGGQSRRAEDRDAEKRAPSLLTDDTRVENALAKAAGHGVMVALHLPLDVAREVSLTGGADADSLHVTVAYLGRDLDEAAVKAVVRAVRRVAADRDPVVATLGGVGRFSASGTSDGKDVAILLVDSAALTNDLRPAIAAACARAGAPARTDHGYIPHVTLAYLDEFDATPVRRAGGQVVTFDALTVSAGGERVVIPFRERG